MTKKDYIFNMANLIKNRVNYHAPINFDGVIDFDKIIHKGIDLSLPVFIIEKALNKDLIKAFLLAQKEVKFNLIIREKNKLALKKLKNCFYIKNGELNELEKLNINYKTMTTYYKIESGNYLKINNEELKCDQIDFYQEGKGLNDGVLIKLKKFLLNGENYFIELCNTKNSQKIIEVEYNKDLDKGYYKFYKLRKSVKILNLTTNRTCFFNANLGSICERYSCVDGIESCTYSRINYKVKLLLKPFEKRCLFINFGENCFTLNNESEMTNFFNISQKECFEIFNIKIESNDKIFEKTFNRVLPIKIWQSWLNGDRNLKLEERYVKIKNNIVLKEGKQFVLQKNNYNIDSIFCFNGKCYKKIAIC